MSGLSLPGCHLAYTRGGRFELQRGGGSCTGGGGGGGN